MIYLDVVGITVKYLGYKIFNILIITLKPRQKGRYFADDILQFIFDENFCVLIWVLLKSVNKIPSLVYRQTVSKKIIASLVMHMRYSAALIIYSLQGNTMSTNQTNF